MDVRKIVDTVRSRWLPSTEPNSTPIAPARFLDKVAFYSGAELPPAQRRVLFAWSADRESPILLDLRWLPGVVELHGWRREPAVWGIAARKHGWNSHFRWLEEMYRLPAKHFARSIAPELFEELFALAGTALEDSGERGQGLHGAMWQLLVCDRGSAVFVETWCPLPSALRELGTQLVSISQFRSTATLD